jgi:hypothetical protein
MNDELYLLMNGWLTSGDETQRRHAAFRLSRPDAVGYVLGSVPTIPAPMSAPPVVVPPRTLGGKAVDFLRTMFRFARSGFRISERLETRRRLGICKRCEHFDRGRCGLCGCFSEIKARLKVADCPDGRWTRPN